MVVLVVVGFCSQMLLTAATPGESGKGEHEIPLVVPAGVPLRLYLTKRIPKREGAPVEAKVLEPVYVFDRQVIPAGAVVLGTVRRLEPVSRAQRTNAILAGDFTPLHRAPVEFTTLIMPDGRKLPLHTAENVGLNSIVLSRPPKKRPPNKQSSAAPPKTGVLGTGEQKVRDAIQAQIAQVKTIPDLVRGPDKTEKIEDYLMAKLPYHPQKVRKGTRFDAELVDPLSFGSAAVTRESLALVGTQPQADIVAHIRLITPLDSASSKQGEAVAAVLSEPVFSADHKLILPEGTRVEGTMVVARRARWFHRSGQLRFNFRQIELPTEVVSLRETIDREAAETPAAIEQRPTEEKTLKIRTQATLQAVESTGKGSLKVDGEGGVEVKDSKTRFLAATAAVLIAQKAADNDAGRDHLGHIGGADQNVGGRTVGGGFGFGLLGAAASQSSKYVGTAFGYYGMAWTLYSTLIARGAEVQFGKNAVMDIRFNTRPAAEAAHGQATKQGRGH